MNIPTQFVPIDPVVYGKKIKMYDKEDGRQVMATILPRKIVY